MYNLYHNKSMLCIYNNKTSCKMLTENILFVNVTCVGLSENLCLPCCYNEKTDINHAHSGQSKVTVTSLKTKQQTSEVNMRK